MLANAVSVGPPLQDLASWNSSKPGRNEESNESFDSTLAENISAKGTAPPVKRVPEPKTPMKGERIEERKVQSQDDVVSQEKEIPDAPVKVTKETPIEKKTALVRQKAIEKFMDSFESEFGISPTRLVEVMATLPAEELNRNPEQTVDSVIAQLDLSEEQEDRAKQMYLTLVSDLNRIDQSAVTPKLMPTPVVPMTPNNAKERFLAAQDRKVNLNRSLDQLNDKFWLRSVTPAVPTQTAEDMAPMRPNMTAVDPWMQQELADKTDLRQALMADDLNNMPVQDNSNNQAPGIVVPNEFESSEEVQDPETIPVPVQLPSRKSQPQSALMDKMRQAMKLEQNSMLKPRNEIPFSPPSKLTKTIEAQKALQSALTESPAYQAALLASLDETETDVETDQPKLELEPGQVMIKPEGQTQTELPLEKVVASRADVKWNMDSEKPQLEQANVKTDAKTTKTVKKAFDSLDSLGHPSLQKAESLDSLGKSSAAIEAGPAFKVRSPAENANIRQIMNQAQYLIKKGGGEMKVEMNPEGLGTMQMKVVVNDGRVNLQMATETKEAKQMIESSLPDLKSHLAAHKLAVDHVKIDVVGSTNTDSSAQNSTSNQQQPKDGGTRQFWQQFQENFGNRSQRDGFFELPAIKGYSQKKRDPLAPVEADSSISRKVEGRGGGIDLVA